MNAPEWPLVQSRTGDTPELAPGEHRAELLMLCQSLPLAGVTKVLEFAREVKFALEHPVQPDNISASRNMTVVRKILDDQF